MALKGLWQELRADKWWLLGITVAAAFMRFFNLTQAALWMDEIVILDEAFTGKFKTVSYAAHSAHLIPQGWFLHLFGQNELGVRFWSALLGTMAIPLIFAWMTWTAGRIAGRITAILACVNCFLIYYSQDGNYYGGMTFYTAAMLCGFAIFFRGAPYAGLLAAVVAGFINYKNHPMAAVPVAVTLGVMTIASVVSPRLRKSIYSIHMNEWRGRPAIPLLLATGIAGAFLVAGAWAGLAKSFSLLSEPGEGTLKNVEWGWGLFYNHLDAFGSNFYRPAEPYDEALSQTLRHGEYALAMAMFVVFIVGLFRLACSLKKYDDIHIWHALLIVLVVAASYYLLFSIQLKRNFYTRYFTYLVPLYLSGVSYALASFQKWENGKLHRSFIAACVTFLFAFACLHYSSIYLLANKRNEKDGIVVLKKEYNKGDRFLLLIKQDRIAANYYFGKAGLPTQSPVYTILQQPDQPGAMGYAFPYVINGMTRTWIVSGWRFPGEWSLYAFVRAALDGRYSGVSKLGEDADLWLSYVSGDERIVYPGLAAMFSLSEGRVISKSILGNRNWRITTRNSPDGFDFSVPMYIDNPPPTTMKAPVDRVMKWIPHLRDSTHLSPVNWPENSTVSEYGGALRNQRDGSFDFLVYQPENETRRLVIEAPHRDENDPVLGRNDEGLPTIPSGLLIGVSADGVHRGFYEVPPGNPSDHVTIIPKLKLTPGNHRISINGLQPRTAYTPYFPWGLGDVQWVKETSVPLNAGPSAPFTKSMEEAGRIKICPGWPTLLATGTPGERPTREWTVGEGYETIVDPELKCVAGDSPIRISFPPKSQKVFTLLTPVMPVEQETLAVYTMYLKLEGLDDNEVTPVHLFIDKDGRQIPGVLHANGSNLRGTTLGVKGWVRRQITVPVPKGAKYMMGGVRVYPVPHGNTTGGKLWIGSVFSPGAGDLKLKDPILPDNYFGVSESTPLPVVDAESR
ncbi:glycosyltransferase family 39 protein [Candidatus Sumerlaeota bacterium]|nr:glycosyltransferase family 39 protein [Candidatus Sumerlaeota bacterium]